MHCATEALEARLAEVLMWALFPCDLGDGIEVVHEVEQIEIEMDCDVEDDPAYSAPYERIELVFASNWVATLAMPDGSAFEPLPSTDTLPFAPFEPSQLMTETTPYPRCSADTVPFVRAPVTAVMGTGDRRTRGRRR
jgi:hypothetical protein